MEDWWHRQEDELVQMGYKEKTKEMRMEGHLQIVSCHMQFVLGTRLTTEPLVSLEAAASAFGLVAAETEKILTFFVCSSKLVKK